MADAPRDDNQVPVACGVDENGDVQPLRVDPVTNRLEIDITNVAYDTAAPTLPATVPRDSNNVPVSCAVTDDAGETVTPLLIDATSGLLWVDLVSE